MINPNKKKIAISPIGGGKFEIPLNPYEKHHEYIIIFLSNFIDFDEPIDVILKSLLVSYALLSINFIYSTKLAKIIFVLNIYH